MSSEFKYVTYETLDDGRIARVLMNRPETRNAQNRALLVDLNDALLKAEEDDQVRVVILGGVGTMFSSGHDLVGFAEMTRGGPEEHPTWLINGGTRDGAEARYIQEWHYFFENTLRWRNLRKITIAEVKGPVLAAGLMMMFACDLVVAADNTTFADVVGTRLGMCGVEYFAHPWEFGPRKTKELMLTGDSIDAEEAYRLGLVSKIFTVEELAEKTLAFARRIAALPTVTALLVKESVNQTVDNMGFYNALHACFTIHQLNHAHWAEIHRDDQPPGFAALGKGRYPAGTVEDGIPDWRDAPPVAPAKKSEVYSPVTT
jgi:enoyl-CoA hydratase